MRARARSVAPFTVTASNTNENDPLSGATWTQKAEEVNQIEGVATVTAPSEPQCASGGSGFGFMVLTVSVGGSEVATLRDAVGNSQTTVTAPFEILRPWLQEPGSDTSRTLTASVQDECTGTHYTINSIGIDVMGAH